MITPRGFSLLIHATSLAWLICVSGLVFSISGCSSGSSNSSDSDTLVESDDSGMETDPDEEPSALDLALQEIIDDFGLATPVATDHLPSIEEALPQLGMKLFYSKSLGGDFDAACVSCHHPALGGADGLSLPVGVDALNPDLLGPGRVNEEGIPLVPRNSPTVFNAGLWDTGLFWDSRVESIGKEPATNGAVSGIRTPDSEFLVADPDAGANLAAAQARFPVTSETEMQTDRFEIGSDNDTVRAHLAARIGDYGVGEGELDENNWLEAFQEAFGVSADAESLVTFDAIAQAIGEYERSMVFIDSPWRQYLEGDLDALSEDAKAGALLFFTPVAQGGAGCGACHNGPLFSDGQHHTLAFPQAGPGAGDADNDDFARERETGNSDDRYRFRTPSLLNIAQTAPYGHAGVYESLTEVVRHYVNPGRAVNDFFNSGGLCGNAQFADVDDCESLYPDNEANSAKALAKLQQEIDAGTTRFQPPRLNNTEVEQVVAFLEALSDPCVPDRDCLAPWIPDTADTGPDGQQLNAVNSVGDFL